MKTRAGAGRAVAIGNFDGVHLGHQQILAELAKHGAEARVPAVVLCFEPQPKEYFAGAQAPGRLMRLRDKAARVAVTLGYFDGEWVEVRGGLKPGDRVVTAGKVALREGTDVQVIGAPAAKKVAVVANAGKTP